ncbi:hypothetical protein BHE90_000436 [Fusarium euwallaceae]|uniref:Uncharacterized protein n=1 Tax=Fusarium euwallaceae TaxID=1147111 RepID=A0A430MAP3_9HYPO|nr:hypothetical protein BHE90_000436 [Fusarium euwallaceae]
MSDEPFYTLLLSTTEFPDEERLRQAMKDIFPGQFWTFYEADGEYVITTHKQAEEVKRLIMEKLNNTHFLTSINLDIRLPYQYFTPPNTMSGMNEEPPLHIVRFSNITPEERDIFHKALTDVVGPSPSVLLEPGDEIVVTSTWPENDLRRAIDQRITLLKALAANPDANSWSRSRAN